MIGLTNSLATFQAIINDFLRNMIEAGDVLVFIDDVMVGTETEEGHNDIVEEVLGRMAENDLFVKPKKCVWKFRQVGFLRVMIGPDGKRWRRKRFKKWWIGQCQEA